MAKKDFFLYLRSLRVLRGKNMAQNKIMKKFWLCKVFGMSIA